MDAHLEEVPGVVELGADAGQAEVGAGLLVGPGLGDRDPAQVGDWRGAARRVRVRRIQGIARVGGDHQRQAGTNPGLRGWVLLPRRSRHVEVAGTVHLLVRVQGGWLELDALQLRRHRGRPAAINGQVSRTLHHREHMTSTVGSGVQPGMQEHHSDSSSQAMIIR